MKKQKSLAKRPSRPGITHKKKAVVRSRPLHKRILLHPFSVMVLLCAGVLIAGSTFHSLAVSYNITATVPAPQPTSPAVIVTPANLQHNTVAPLQVQGTCPAQSYVKLYRNTAFSGVSQCSAGMSFQIQTSVSQGANTLQARVFNAIDQEGPISSPVTVYYDQTTLPPAPAPSNTPTNIGVSRIESGLYDQGSVQRSSANPTVSGTAPPFADILVTFHSDVETCKTTADADGNWRCTLDHPLPIGLHHVDITATTVGGQQLSFPTFQINVLASLVSVLKPILKPPLLVGSEYHYQIYRVGQQSSFAISVSDSVGPYKIVADWGDGTQSESTQDHTSFTLTHTYTSPNTYVVVVKVTDANGTTSLIQLSAVVKSNGAVGLATVSGGGPVNSTLNWLGHWLWVVWPIYIFVTLMALSYWIGEQEAYRQLFNRRSHRAAKK